MVSKGEHENVRQQVREHNEWEIENFVGMIDAAEIGDKSVPSRLQSQSFDVTLRDWQGDKLSSYKFGAVLDFHPENKYLAVCVRNFVCRNIGLTSGSVKSAVVLRLPGGQELPPDRTSGGLANLSCSSGKLQDNFFLKRKLFQVGMGCKVTVVVTVEVDYEYDYEKCGNPGDAAKIPSAAMQGQLAKKLWQSRDATGDVTLACGQIKIKAHKTVLAALSDIFAAMFSHKQMAESQTGKVDIKDIDPKCLKEFVHYIYMDELISNDTSVKTLEGLLFAADKYLVASLKAMCEFKLSKVLTVDNVCGIGALADMCNASRLKDSIVQFLIKDKNYARVAADETGDWDELPKGIAKDVLKLVARKQSMRDESDDASFCFD